MNRFANVSGARPACLAGFDLRVRPYAWVDHYWKSEMRKAYLPDPNVELPLSFDQIVWPRVDPQECVSGYFYGKRGPPKNMAGDTNGLDLFVPVEAIEPTSIQDSAQTDLDACLIAVTLAEETAARYLSILGPYPSCSERFISRMGKWTFLGFDVVHLLSGISGLTDCTAPERMDWESLRVDYCPKVNRFSMISSESDAMDFARRLSKIIAEHSPFEPVGLWTTGELQ